MQALQGATLVLVNSLLFVWLVTKVKALFMSSSFTIARETELGGENVTIMGSAYIWDSPEKRFERLNALAETVVERKGYCFNRYENILREEEREKSKKLRGV